MYWVKLLHNTSSLFYLIFRLLNNPNTVHSYEALIWLLRYISWPFLLFYFHPVQWVWMHNQFLEFLKCSSCWLDISIFSKHIRHSFHGTNFKHWICGWLNSLSGVFHVFLKGDARTLCPPISQLRWEVTTYFYEYG